ncbi:pentatricopeptide repeat-containing protein [Tripterygium wilfordii]|uniref:Pentatricopeptide repeat-containing protein n=1 Tax=Tripterygium wilfordii TaxID=458696 RepID=A0A7J7D1S3_TRIWF|nr:pentatricopeptide repeat-containing protein [Tripterygium wilfordii]
MLLIRSETIRTMMENSFFSSPILRVPFKFKIFSSFPSLTSHAEMETQLRTISEKQKPQFSDAVCLFHRAVDSSLLPSGSYCNSSVTMG